MVTLVSNSRDISRMRADLASKVEEVGFFLADFDPATNEFRLRDWQVVHPSKLRIQGAFHIALSDEVQTEAIQRAWEAKSVLVEVHSHLSQAEPCFSTSDLLGFEDWVPHVRWRLGGVPYAAMVWNREGFDGFAWVGAGSYPIQIDFLELRDTGTRFRATARTVSQLGESDDD